MPAQRPSCPINHPIVISFLLFAVIGFMSLASEVLKPLALAVLLSFALAPVAGFLERWGLPRFLAVVLTVLLALGGLGEIGYKVGQQLTTLALNADRYEANIRAKLKLLKPGEASTLDKLIKVSKDVAQSLNIPAVAHDQKIVPVQVVSQPSYREQLQTAVGPYLEGALLGVFVLILVLFMLANREDLSDRIVRLCGPRRVSITTKTMEEVGQRISRYLGMFALVNSTIGLVVGLGLWAIGVHYAVLWGVLAALLRFIPYVGPATAFVLPFVFSIADTPDATWRQPLMVLGLFAVIEALANSFLEPVIYGRTTGVSALGLLVAAMFWTWLWGMLGLLLSTPMTVCLAVLGKYVPGLGFFATLLGEETPLGPDVRFYQRLLAMDQDGAIQVVETALKRQPRAEVFDQILIPTLARSNRDREREDIDGREQAFIWRVVSDLLDDLEEAPALDLKTLAPPASGAEPSPNGAPVEAPSIRILGVAANDQADALALRMLSLLLTPRGYSLRILTTPETPLKLAEQVAEAEPQLVVLSHLPPGGFTVARYLVRRLRARFSDLRLLVGRWGESGDPLSAAERLTSLGASHVVIRLADARDHIEDHFRPKPEPAGENITPLPASPAPESTSV